MPSRTKPRALRLSDSTMETLRECRALARARCEGFGGAPPGRAPESLQTIDRVVASALNAHRVASIRQCRAWGIDADAVLKSLAEPKPEPDCEPFDGLPIPPVNRPRIAYPDDPIRRTVSVFGL